jgi:uncharacterized membrane protein (DUF106 family)
MSPQAKYNMKWILTVVGGVIGILITVISATANITTKFNKNDADHQAIQVKMQVESAKAEQSLRTIKRLEDKIDEFGAKQVQVMTKQNMILKAIEKQN